MWLLPLLCGMLSYYEGRIKVADSGKASSAMRAASQRSRGEPVTDVAGEMEKLNDQIFPEEAPASGEELKQKILDLDKAEGDHGYELEQLLEELMDREGAAALSWCGDHLPPDLVRKAIGDVASHDPDATFEYVVSSSLFQPCSPGDLTFLLDHQAASGQAALKQAVARVPWERFAEEAGSDRKITTPSLSPGGSAHFETWRESGVLRSLAGMGVDIDFRRWWASADAKDALKEWVTWPHPSTDSPANGKDDLKSLQAILWADHQPSAEVFKGFWDGSSDVERTRIAGALRAMRPEDLGDERQQIFDLIGEEGK